MSIPVSQGVTKEIVEAGDPSCPVRRGSNVTVHCVGSLTSGMKKFWSTKDPGQQPFTFRAGVGQVIAGWDEGCMTMCKGERAKISMSGDKGYGPNGFQAWGIPPNAGLTFELTIIDIKQ